MNEIEPLFLCLDICTSKYYFYCNTWQLCVICAINFQQDFPRGPDITLSPPRMQEGAYQLGLLQFCSPLVRKYCGCGQKLKSRNGRDNNLQIPPPPHDMVIITATRRQYWQNGAQKRGHLGNVYFHCKVNCIKLMQPAFVPCLVVIPSVLCPHLLPVHQQHIAKELQIV